MLFLHFGRHLPRARGFVSSFCTILSYAISSATPESLTSFSLMAIQMLWRASNSSSSSNACNTTNRTTQRERDEGRCRHCHWPCSATSWPGKWRCPLRNKNTHTNRVRESERARAFRKTNMQRFVQE